MSATRKVMLLIDADNVSADVIEQAVQRTRRKGRIGGRDLQPRCGAPPGPVSQCRAVQFHRQRDHEHRRVEHSCAAENHANGEHEK